MSSHLIKQADYFYDANNWEDTYSDDCVDILENMAAEEVPGVAMEVGRLATLPSAYLINIPIEKIEVEEGEEPDYEYEVAWFASAEEAVSAYWAAIEKLNEKA